MQFKLSYHTGYNFFNIFVKLAVGNKILLILEKLF